MCETIDDVSSSLKIMRILREEAVKKEYRVARHHLEVMPGLPWRPASRTELAPFCYMVEAE